jgi:hypothetical protein
MARQHPRPNPRPSTSGCDCDDEIGAPPAGQRPMPIRTSSDALRLVELAISRPLRHETIAFMFDRNGFGGTVVVVAGTVQPDAVLDVADCMSVAGHSTPDLVSLVIATVRPGGATTNPMVALDDVDRWLEASAIADEYGIELVEWYVIGTAGHVECPRDILGEPPRWR